MHNKAQAAQTVHYTAPAKINLALHVTGRRDDGYHLLDMLVVFADYGDRITVGEADEDSFSIGGRFAHGIPLDSGNLVIKARDALRSHTERSFHPLQSILKKDSQLRRALVGAQAMRRQRFSHSMKSGSLALITQHWPNLVSSSARTCPCACMVQPMVRHL